MSLATLRVVEERLASAVEAAQRHLELTAALDPSAPCSHDIADRFQTLASSIERLESELQTAISTVVSQSRHKRVTAAPEAPAQEIDVIDLETETEDELKELEQQKPSQDSAKATPTAEETAEKLQCFVLATGEASAALEIGRPHALRKIPNALKTCHRIGGDFLAMMEGGEPVDEGSSSLFRDTVGRLAAVLEDARLDGKVKTYAKMLVVVTRSLGGILEMADKVAGVPPALSDAALRSAHLKLKTCASKVVEERFASMRNFVRGVQTWKRGVTAEKVEGPIKHIAVELRLEMNMRTLFEQIDLPARSEEQWAFFKEVAEALADWLSRSRMNTKPPNALKPLLRTAKRFQQAFPDRMPDSLIRAASTWLRLSSQGERSKNTRFISKKKKTKTQTSGLTKTSGGA